MKYVKFLTWAMVALLGFIFGWLSCDFSDDTTWKLVSAAEINKKSPHFELNESLFESDAIWMTKTPMGVSIFVIPMFSSKDLPLLLGAADGYVMKYRHLQLDDEGVTSFDGRAKTGSTKYVDPQLPESISWIQNSASKMGYYSIEFSESVRGQQVLYFSNLDHPEFGWLLVRCGPN